MTYTPEVIPGKVIQEMLENHWSDQEGQIPAPSIVDLNETGEDAIIRWDLQNSGDLIIVRLDNTGISENWRDSYKYADVRTSIELPIRTSISRQRLYDLMQEARRIVRAYKHNFSGFHLVKYLNFIEANQQQMNYWEGTARLQTINDRIYIG